MVGASRYTQLCSRWRRRFSACRHRRPAGGQALPWEAPLTRLQQSLSGPVAGAIAIIALVAIGVTLVFGGEWNEFARRAVYAVCAIAFIISATAMLGGLFAVGAAVV